MERRRSSVIFPSHPALWIALSIASNFVHCCSGMTSGRYVAENERLDVEERRVDGRCQEEERGDGVLEGEVTDKSVEGCAKLMHMPCVPIVQSK